jgi:hypothetical protein
LESPALPLYHENASSAAFQGILTPPARATHRPTTPAAWDDGCFSIREQEMTLRNSSAYRFSARSLLVVLVVAALGASTMAEPPRSLLFYGNSFTLGIGSTEAETFGGVPEVVRQLAVAAGYSAPRVENAAVAGQTLGWHLANNAGSITDPTDFVEMPGFQWDAVIIQEYSTEPTHVGNPAAFRSNALTMFGLVRKHSPAARAVLFETWARGPGHSFYTGGSPAFPGGPAQMQQELRDNYELARQDLVSAHGAGSTVVARVGDAWEAAGWANLHADDIYHANTRGTYLTGLVIFGTIYGQRTTAGLPKLFASLSESEAAALQAIADQYLPPGAPFDANGDGNVNGADLDGFAECLSGPQSPAPKAPPCDRMDGNADGAVDARDSALMQAAAAEALPYLNFGVWDMTFSAAEGSKPIGQMNVVTAENAKSPTVSLAVQDLVTPGVPKWLSVPPTVESGQPFAVNVDPSGLSPGVYYARVSAAAKGYRGSSFALAVNVTSATGSQAIFVDFGDIAQQTRGTTTMCRTRRGRSRI